MARAAPDDVSIETHYTCRRTDSILSVIEKCLDNGLGSCLVVGEDQAVEGEVSLDDIRAALHDGSAVADATLAWYRAAGPLLPLRNDVAREARLLPVIDPAGRLAGVQVDRSTGPVQVARPHITHGEFRRLLDAFLSGWISSKGPEVQAFERAFSRFVGVPHGISVTNGTVALHLALVSLGIGPGDEVIVPDLTFAATINAVLHCGATPVIVDVDRETWCMGREAVQRACSPRTRAIIPVHLYGRPAEIGPIVALAQAQGIAVVEDCAEAHGARYRDRAVGSYGDVGCFSFYGNKLVSTGEGGMCLTGCDTVARSLERLRDHGMATGRAYWHEAVGFNYRMTNLQAALGGAQLERIDETLARNAAIAVAYREALAGIEGVRFPPPLPDHCQPVTWLACVQVPADRRDAVLAAGRAAEIEMRPFFHPLSVMPPYASFSRSCPNSVELAATGLNLPTSSAVDAQVVYRVARVFRSVLS